LDGSGSALVPGAQSLRGIAIDNAGRIWVADLEGDKVWRLDKDGKNPVAVTVKTPVALAADGGQVLVSGWLQRQISIIDIAKMEVSGVLGIPWEQLELAPAGNNGNGALSGIAVLAGRGFLVANERGQTANQRSTYGRVDANSEVIEGKVYTDTFVDDNEPLLRAEPVTVTSP
jgi:hypothetical protein